MKWENVNCGPIQCKRFSKAVSAASWSAKGIVELSGPMEDESKQSRTCMTAIVGGYVNQDVVDKLTALGSAYGWKLNKSDLPTIMGKLEQITTYGNAHKPVEDHRTTAEQRAEHAENRERMKQEQETKRAARLKGWQAIYGDDDSPTVAVPDGQMAVCLRLCFNNSDSMTDYFDYHATLSPDYAVLVQRKGPARESTARKALALLPDTLQALDWGWHTENYSMGHGNYLESEVFALSADQLEAAQGRESYRGGVVTHGHYELVFDKYSVEKRRHRCQGQRQETDKPAGPVSEATITRNTERDGVEIRFPAKPDASVLAALKAHGWRWSRPSVCWYKRYSAEAEQFASQLTA